MNITKNYLFIFLVILILTGSVFMGYKVRDVAHKEIINAQDVVHTFKAGGIIFKPETSLYPKEFKVKDTEPTIYKDSQGNLLFIYTFDSFVERRESFQEYEHIHRFSFNFEENTYLPEPYRVKNLQLIYSMACPDSENAHAAIDYRRKLGQIIFTNLNAGEEIVFTGESPSWDAKASVRYYEHWWTDSKNKVQYESYHTDETSIAYKGQIPEQAIPMEHSVSTRFSKSKGTREITPEMLTRVINLSAGGGNGPIPREDDVYEVKITLNGKTEEFKLKSKYENYGSTEPNRGSIHSGLFKIRWKPTNRCDKASRIM